MMPSQIDFDIPPLYDPIINAQNMMYLSNVWIAYWSSFYQTLMSYISQNGFYLPQLTMAERNSLINNTNGQLIYNTDPGVDGPQFWQASSQSWRTIQFV